MNTSLAVIHGVKAKHNQPMTETDTQELLEHLLEHHKGKHNAITQKKLAKKLEMNTSTLRSELRRLREERNIPIGNLRHGYFLITDKEELQDYIGHINSEIESKKNTIEHTLEAFESFDGDVSVESNDSEQEVQEQTYKCAKCETEMPRDETRWPKQGPFEDQTVCGRCYGNIIINR